MSPRRCVSIPEKVNKQLCESNEKGMFVTVWMGIPELSRGRLVRANAGHEDPILLRNGKAGPVSRKHGMVMACMEEPAGKRKSGSCRGTPCSSIPMA